MNSEILKYEPFDKEKILSTIEEYNSNGKLTIGIATDNFYPYVDGVVNDVNNLATYLSEKMNVVLFCPAVDNKVLKAPYLVWGIKCYYIHYVNYHQSQPQKDEILKEYLSKLKMDIVQINTPFRIGNMLSKHAKENNIPLISTFHSQYKRDFKKALKSWLLTEICVKILIQRYSRSNEVWVMNKFTDKLFRQYGHKGVQKIMLHRSNFIAPTEEERANLIEKINRMYSLEKEKNVLLFLGTLRKEKGILFVAKALSILSSQNVPFKMIYVGSGQDEEKLKKLINKLDVADKCNLVGRITDKQILAGLYARADLFLFPSIYDTDGLVKFEAAACKTPTLAIENTGASSNLTDNENGFIAKNNYFEYGKKIQALLEDKNKLDEIGKNAYSQLYLPRLKAEQVAYERILELINETKQKK